MILRFLWTVYTNEDKLYCKANVYCCICKPIYAILKIINHVHEKHFKYESFVTTYVAYIKGVWSKWSLLSWPIHLITSTVLFHLCGINFGPISLRNWLNMYNCHFSIPTHLNNGRHSANCILKCIFLKESLCIFSQKSLTFVMSLTVINRNSALFRIKTW